MDRLRRVFEEHGERVDGSYRFDSLRKLRDALTRQGLATGNAQAEAMIDAIVSDYARKSEDADDPRRPIVESGGKRGARVFTWSAELPDVEF